MEENVRLAYLYDTYGELLSEHQKQIFEAACFNDLSLSELAEDFSVSRQAAHDVYRRTVSKLEHYEQMLHLVEREQRLRSAIEEILRLAEGSIASQNGAATDDNTDAGRLAAIAEIARGIIDDEQE